MTEYVDGKIRGEVATKEDLLLLKADLEGKIQEVREELHGVQVSLEAKIQGVREELKAEIQGVREEVWKLRLLIVVVLIVVIVLNPKVLELVGRALGVAK